MKPLIVRSLALAPAVGMVLLTGFAPAASARAVMPMEQTHGMVHFVSGGIGSDESAAMKQAASRYALELVFAKRQRGNDDYLAYVPVVIRNAEGNVVLDTRSRGPYLLANLPGGTYTVTATERGIAKQQTVHVAAGNHQSLVFEW